MFSFFNDEENEKNERNEVNGKKEGNKGEDKMDRDHLHLNVVDSLFEFLDTIDKEVQQVMNKKEMKKEQQNQKQINELNKKEEHKNAKKEEHDHGDDVAITDSVNNVITVDETISSESEIDDDWIVVDESNEETKLKSSSTTTATVTKKNNNNNKATMESTKPNDISKALSNHPITEQQGQKQEVDEDKNEKSLFASMKKFIISTLKDDLELMVRESLDDEDEEDYEDVKPQISDASISSSMLKS